MSCLKGIIASVRFDLPCEVGPAIPDSFPWEIDALDAFEQPDQAKKMPDMAATPPTPAPFNICNRVVFESSLTGGKIPN